MKVVINVCHGGFSISRKAVKRMAELKGIPCYFFKHDYDKGYTPIDEDEDVWFWSAFTVPNPDEVAISQKKWNRLSMEEKQKSNRYWSAITIESRDIERNDPILIQVVGELGKDANGECADLQIVEIPDGVKWTIEEYDGKEWVAEVHRTWS
jgi:hypothetical protein